MKFTSVSHHPDRLAVKSVLRKANLFARTVIESLKRSYFFAVNFFADQSHSPDLRFRVARIDSLSNTVEMAISLSELKQVCFLSYISVGRYSKQLGNSNSGLSFYTRIEFDEKSFLDCFFFNRTCICRNCLPLR